MTDDHLRSHLAGAGAPFAGRALLVEDNAIVALDAQDMLTSLGFAPIDTAPSAARALELLSAHDYAAALVDLTLRDGPSAPAIAALTARRVPFVIASGYEESALPAVAAAAPRIAKPYDEAMVRDALGHAFARARLHSGDDAGALRGE